MENLAKPHLAEVLGVEVGEKFAVKMEGCTTDSLIIGDDGFLRYADTTIADVFSLVLCQAINCPESIIHAPHLTEPEMAICKALGARWVSIGPCSDFIMLTKTKPTWDGECNDWLIGKESVLTGDPIARIRKTLFPSVHSCDCICVEEVSSE